MIEISKLSLEAFAGSANRNRLLLTSAESLELATEHSKQRDDLAGKISIALKLNLKDAIADNRTAELADWDDDVLAAQLNGLLADDESLALATGFSNEELEKLVGEIDDAPELKEKPVLDPPVMSWVLIGIPTVRFAEVAADVERIAQLPDVICETTSNGG
jgi:hypothetical protein